MNIPIETIDRAFVRDFAIRLSMKKSPVKLHKSIMPKVNSMERLVPGNLIEFDEEDCLEILGGNSGEGPSSTEDSSEEQDAEPNPADNISSWFSTFCCLVKCWKAPPPPVLVPEPVMEVPVVTITAEIMRKKDLCIQNWMDMLEPSAPIPPPIEEPPVPPEPKKEQPELISRRADIPVVVSSKNRPFLRGTHQYYRSSWRLKPSVIGAPETLGVD